MGNGNRSGFEGCVGSERTPSSSSSLDFDVGLGLKMQHTESNPCKKTTTMAHPPYHHHHPSPESCFGGDCGGYGSRGGGPVYCNTANNNQVASGSGIYDAVGAVGSVSGGAAALPRTLHPFTADTFLKSSGGGMAACGKVLFTASQWQELERQSMIYKYMMASIPIPHQLLLPFTKSQSHVPVSQSNTAALDLRFSSGSDPEPWRCRRTDGKKWRCSRDVAPDLKYCERHAHKSRPRSRKPVENQAHTTTTAPNITTTATNNYTHYPSILPPYTTTSDSFQKPVSQFPTLASATSYDQTRCIEWFMKGGNIPVSTSNQQLHHLMQSSSRLGLKRDSTDHSKNVSFYQQQYEEEHGPMSLNNPYMDGGSHQELNDCSMLNHPKLVCFQGGNNTAQTTRHFIDAWSTAEREDVNAITNKCSVSSSARKLPLSSLTLSMSGGNGIDEDNENAQMGGGGMMDGDGRLKSQWVNPASWMGSPPGGPLGEALCLGMASNVKAAASNVPSPHGYSNSTTTSSCSKSSCDDGGQGLNFH